MIYIGIDPGKSGALAAIYDNGSVETFPWDGSGYAGFFRESELGSYFAIVEKVNAMPGQGVKSMFNFGQNFGMIQGVLISFGVPYELIPPNRWKRAFGLSKDKGKSIEVAQRLFPSVSLLRTDRCKKPHDGIAEALLMAEYARMVKKGG